MENTMSIHDKAQQYAQLVIDSFGLNGVPNGIKDIRQMITEGYIIGAKTALRSQWKCPNVELPPDGHFLTFITTKEECQLEIACWSNEKYQGSMAMLVNLGVAKVRAWMEIPDLY